jgi:hypothetical protein
LAARSVSSSGVTSCTERLAEGDVSAEPLKAKPPTRMRPAAISLDGSFFGVTVSLMLRRLRNVPGLAATRASMSIVVSSHPDVPRGKEAMYTLGPSITTPLSEGGASSTPLPLRSSESSLPFDSP